MSRKKNLDWNLPEVNSWDSIKVAILMDIRDELQTLNRLLACKNFEAIPSILRGIRTNTTKRVRKVKP
jgi:hypothetical protein